MIYKKFSQNLFNKNDPKVRKIVKEWLIKSGRNAVDAKDIYGPDIWVENKNYYIEVERKHNWKSERFPFPTVNIPQRKNKYLKYGKVYYFILSKNYKQAIIINGKYLKEEYLHEVSNKYVSSGEYFYQIPLELCKIIKI